MAEEKKEADYLLSPILPRGGPGDGKLVEYLFSSYLAWLFLRVGWMDGRLGCDVIIYGSFYWG